MTDPPVRVCWCGGELGKEIGRHYRSCHVCGAGVLTVRPAPGHFEVRDDERDFYGRRYWTEFSRMRGLPDIQERVRADLSERCVFWLERLLEVAHPPGRALEVGCGHGALVGLLRELGFDAMGTELSGWVVDFARRTFDVPVLQGRLETLDLEPGFACILALDVLEHVSEPLEFARRCGDLLAPDGVLLLQTPCYRGEGPDWSMFQPEEHIHLFTEESIRLLLARAGLADVLVRPSLFPYDMWVVASRGRPRMGLSEGDAAVGDWRLPVAFRSLLDLSRQVRVGRDDLALVEADRAARLAQVEELTALLRESEADRAARLEQLQRIEAARADDVRKLTALLRESEADRAARLEQLQRIEAARADDVRKLTALLRDSEADRAARLDVIHRLEARIAKIEGTWAWRLYRTLPASLTGRNRAG